MMGGQVSRRLCQTPLQSYRSWWIYGALEYIIVESMIAGCCADIIVELDARQGLEVEVDERKGPKNYGFRIRLL
jgi:hypothetical protein